MLKIEFGMGVGIDAAGKGIPTDRRRLGISQIRDAAVSLFGGCTLTQTTGDWWDKETDTLFCEEGITLVVLTERPDYLLARKELEAKVRQLAETIKRSLCQKAVFVTRYNVQSKLY